MPRHTDGSICLEGTSSVPSNYAPCCDIFAGHTTACTYDIRYEWWSKSRTWQIMIPELAGGGGISIAFCPHCGVRLPDAKRRMPSA